MQHVDNPVPLPACPPEVPANLSPSWPLAALGDRVVDELADGGSLGVNCLGDLLAPLGALGSLRPLGLLGRGLTCRTWRSRTRTLRRWCPWSWSPWSCLVLPMSASRVAGGSDTGLSLWATHRPDVATTSGHSTVNSDHQTVVTRAYVPGGRARKTQHYRAEP